MTDIWSIDGATRPFRVEPPLHSLHSDIYYGPRKIGVVSIRKAIDPCGLDSRAEVTTTFEIGNDERSRHIKREFEVWLEPQVKKSIRGG